MKKKRRLSGLLALLLCLCLALSLVPGTAFAEGDELPVAPYCTWEKATVLTPGAPVSFVPDTYHNDYTAEQLWFAVNVDGDDLAICMDFDVKSYLEVKLYDAAVLGESGPSYNNSRRSKTVSGTQTLSWKVPFAGVYYLMLRPGGSGYESDKAGTLTVSLLDGDTNEPNDTLETAAPLTVNVDTVYNLNGSNDEDWFKITTLKAGQAVKTVLTGFNYETKPVTAVLCDAEGNALTYHRGISADTEFYWKAGEPADYYLKLVSYQSDAFVPQSLKVRFELVDGDPNENNDGWQAAADLSAEVTSYYTLTGYNDEDWFKLSTLNPGEAIKVTLDAVTATVYMGEEGLDLTAAVHPSYATNQNVVWSSSDESVAAVDALGHVTAVSPGYVDITAAAQENPALKAVCRLSVQPARIRVESISFEKTEIEIGLYVSMSLTPVITPANATDKSVTWTTSNKNIVSVSRNGVITGLNTGSAVITATTADGGKVATISVLVTAGAALGDLNSPP